MLVTSVLLVSWHRATVLHGHCLEHGEMIELTVVAAGPHATPNPGSAEMSSADWTRLGTGEHCAILAVTHVPLTSTASVALAHVVVASDVAAEPAPLPALVAVPLYSLAPKTSPPAHA